jgi:hypothetical protein
MFRDAEYLCGAIMALVQLPAFWLVMGSRDDHGDATGTLALAATLLFCAILILSVLGHPIGNGRYSGIMDNANTFAFVLLPCLPFLLWAVMGRWLFFLVRGSPYSVNVSGFMPACTP